MAPASVVASARRVLEPHVALTPRRSPSRADSTQSLLENGQVVVGELEDDQAHGGGIRRAVAVGPLAAGAFWAGQQLVPDGREPPLPVVAAGRPHGQGRVILAVKVVLRRDLA